MNCSDDDEVEFLGTTNNVNSKHTAKTKTKTTINSNDIIGLAEYRAEASLKYQQRKQKSNNNNRTNKDNVIDVDAIDFSSSKGLSGSLPPVPSSILGSLRNKHAYLHTTTNNTNAKKHSYNDSNNNYAVRRAGNTIIDSHPNAYSDGGWIWVNDPNYKYNKKCSRVDSSENLSRFLSEFNNNQLIGTNYTHGQIVDLARKHNILHGKWLIDISPQNVLQDWPLIRNAILDSKLASTAKISDTPDNSFHKVCVYCPNFDDKAEVLRVRQAILNDVQISTDSTLRFKLDAFRYCGIYAGSGIRTTTYDCGGIHDLQCTTLITAHEKCTNCVDCPRCYPSCLPESATKSATKPKKSIPTLNADKDECTDLELIVVGLKHHKDNLKALDCITLQREPQNAYDYNAIACMNGEGGIVGYIKRDKALVLSPVLDANIVRITKVSLLYQTNATLHIAVDLTVIHRSDNDRNMKQFLDVLQQLGGKIVSDTTASKGKKKRKTKVNDLSLDESDGMEKVSAKSTKSCISQNPGESSEEDDEGNKKQPIKSDQLLDDDHVKYYDFEEGSMKSCKREGNVKQQTKSSSNPHQSCIRNENDDNRKCSSTDKKVSQLPNKLHHDNKQTQNSDDDMSFDHERFCSSTSKTPIIDNTTTMHSCKESKPKVIRGSKKEQKKKAKAKNKKRCRFDSSSSSDDEGFEEMKRRLREKQKEF